MSYCQSCADLEKRLDSAQRHEVEAASLYEGMLEQVEELRRFKAAALTLTTEASVNLTLIAMSRKPYMKNDTLVHHASRPITGADVEEAMSKDKT